MGASPVRSAAELPTAIVSCFAYGDTALIERFIEGRLAAEALKIFNERNIDDLIVVNAKNEPVGLVDSQDLPKLKIV